MTFGVMVAVVGVTGPLLLERLERRTEHLPPVDPHDRFAVALRAAHEDLNSAVGWDDWRPRYLTGTAPRLRQLAARYPNAEVELVDAAVHIERAVREGNRDDAVVAHRIIAGLEQIHRDNIRRQRRGEP